MEQPDSHGICADYHYMNSEEWKYIFYQTSQGLYTELFSSQVIFIAFDHSLS